MLSSQLAKRFPGLVILTACVALVGCGPSDGMLNINGTITMDGKPVEAGSITITPVDGSSKVGGGTFENGTFSTRAAPGEMAVQIRGHEIIQLPHPTKEQVERGLDTERREIIPAAYNNASKLRIDISPDNTTFDFALTKDGKIPEGMSTNK
ncbi:hypothetical protein DTL42_09440 [Bremerella cremea]|uniref:Carboxypeptidase regulatory-like domain-containing protein n=1 Tax=Bremerella cremea TaxID=1031537 RepID=A0A368KTR9_9BACT|nr:hypothetical protein [Bremerella cremea]RCS53026.1 hypothetical protein DTL42_09440 [Bremerella cremea]